MIVLRHNFKTYVPRLTIYNCLILNEIYGDVIAPIIKTTPSTPEMCYILSLCLGEEDEDNIYDIMDSLENPLELILRIYEEAGLINQDAEQDPIESDSEPLEGGSNDSIPTFYDYVEEMRQQCMNFGMTREDFYNSTLKEIEQTVESMQSQRQSEVEQQAVLDYTLASLIRIGVASVLSNNIEFPSLVKAYPFLEGLTDETTEQPTPKQERKLGVVDKEAWDDGLTPEQRAEEIAFIRRMEQIEAINKKRREKEQAEKQSNDNEGNE